MKVISLLKSDRPTLSFEVFPPKTQDKFENVIRAAYEIGSLKPDFMSVTYGAGGGRSRYTVEMVDQMQKELSIPVLSHLTCVSSTRAQVHEVLGKLKERGIENILALRGDIPEDGGMREYEHAADLIEEIRSYGDFCIGAACYPEGHPESADKNEDLRYLKEKVDCGVDFLTTQMFFDNNILYAFLPNPGDRDQCTGVRGHYAGHIEQAACQDRRDVRCLYAAEFRGYGGPFRRLAGSDETGGDPLCGGTDHRPSGQRGKTYPCIHHEPAGCCVRHSSESIGDLAI